MSMHEVSPGIHSKHSNLRWGLVPDQDVVFHWNDVNKAFQIYRNTGNRTRYLAVMQEQGFDAKEAIILWQGFDRAEEEWHLRGCACYLVNKLTSLKRWITRHL